MSTASLRTIEPRNLLANAAAVLRSPPPLWLLGAVIVLGEAACSIVGVRSILLSGLALLAPGFALAPLLPGAVRRHRLATLAAAPALGIAVTSVVVITLARVGITLSGASLRLALVALVALGLFAWSPHRKRASRPDRAELLEALGLLGAVAFGLVLALRVVGGNLLPGNDWAKYLLYADEVRRNGRLLMQNPYWLLGVPFRDDPGVPALYGSALILSRAPAGVLGHGILVFSTLQVTSVFAFARAHWGAFAGVLAAALVAVVPASQDILGWHGLANLAALVLLALLLAYLGAYARGELDVRAKIGLALSFIGLAAAHRLSAIVGSGLASIVVIACLLAPGRRRAARDAAQLIALTLVLGAGVIGDLYARERTFGGSLSYTAYLSTKVNASLALRDVSPVLGVALLVALLVIVVRHRSDRALWPAVAMLAVSVALAWAWLAHIPNYYGRMVFYVPLAAAPLVAAVVGRLPWRAMTLAGSAVAIVAIALTAFPQARNVRAYYAFATPAALRGLDALKARLRPNEVVVTDRCWSFLATWLLHTRTLAALSPADIQPKAELRLAERAQQILEWTPAGEALARALGVRYLVVDPTCPTPTGGLLAAPVAGVAVYESQNLAILRLPRG